MSKGVVEAFDMIGQAGLFTNRLVLFVREYGAVRPPKIGVDDALPVVFGNCVPQPLTGRFTPPADHTRHDLPRSFAQGKPNPALITFVTDKRPQLIEFQLDPLRLSRFEQRVFERRLRQGFFLSHAITVVRDTPNVLASPRRLERSS